MSAKYGYIGNNPSDTSVVVAKQVFAPTGVQTTFTFVSGYSIGYLDVYINGARQVEGQDYNATDTSTVGLSSAAQGGDIIELVAYKAFNVATVDTIPGDLRVQGKLTVVGLTTGSNAFYSGIVTATSFSGSGANLTGISSVSFATTSFGLSGSPNITVGNITGSAATFSNNLNVGTGLTLSSSGINATGVVTATSGFVGNITGSAATFSNNLNVGTAITMYGSTGIISATKYYGDGSSLSGIDATRIVSGLSSVTVASSGTISAYVNGSNIFNVTGTGVTMTSGKRLDVSSYSENVNFLGSVSGSTALDVGTYTSFIADISGTTSVTFTLTGAVSGRLSSATLILRFSGSGSRNVSLAINPKYVGGVGPTYSTTAVTDIISFFTVDAGTITYVSVAGQGFA